MLKQISTVAVALVISASVAKAATITTTWDTSASGITMYSDPTGSIWTDFDPSLYATPATALVLQPGDQIAIGMDVTVVGNTATYGAGWLTAQTSTKTANGGRNLAAPVTALGATEVSMTIASSNASVVAPTQVTTPGFSDVDTINPLNNTVLRSLPNDPGAVSGGTIGNSGNPLTIGVPTVPPPVFSAAGYNALLSFGVGTSPLFNDGTTIFQVSNSATNGQGASITPAMLTSQVQFWTESTQSSQQGTVAGNGTSANKWKTYVDPTFTGVNFNPSTDTATDAAPFYITISAGPVDVAELTLGTAASTSNDYSAVTSPQAVTVNHTVSGLWTAKTVNADSGGSTATKGVIDLNVSGAAPGNPIYVLLWLNGTGPLPTLTDGGTYITSGDFFNYLSSLYGMGANLEPLTAVVMYSNFGAYNNLVYSYDLNGTGYTSLDDIAVVPEPASLGLLALGALGLLTRRRR